MALEILQCEMVEGIDVEDKPLIEEVDAEVNVDNVAPGERLSRLLGSSRFSPEDDLEEFANMDETDAPTVYAGSGSSKNHTPVHDPIRTHAGPACCIVNLQRAQRLTDVQVAQWMTTYILKGTTNEEKRGVLRSIIWSGVQKCFIHGRRLVGVALPELSAVEVASWMLKKEILAAGVDNEEVRCLRGEIAEFVDKIHSGELSPPPVEELTDISRTLALSKS